MRSFKRRFALIDKSWKYTDIISDYQRLVCWGFNYKKLKSISKTGDYSDPVRESMFFALQEMAESGNRFIRERHFTIFMGDYGDENQFFWVGVRWSTSRRILDILGKFFDNLKGYEYMEEFVTPWVPLVPMYRYEYGIVIEYIRDYKNAGKKHVDAEYNTAIEMQYRLWVSAEMFKLRQKYKG